MSIILDSNSQIISLTAESDIKMGKVVCMGDEGVKQFEGGDFDENVKNFVGISVGSKDLYKKGEQVPVLIKGLVRVECDKYVASGMKMAVCPLGLVSYIDANNEKQTLDLDFETFNAYCEEEIEGNTIKMRIL